ncbi:MAG: hypothetical protein AAFX93_18700 [Verrucomicrobiota bacterium]
MDFTIKEASTGVEIVTSDGLRMLCANRAIAEGSISVWTGKPTEAPVSVEAITDEPELPKSTQDAYARRHMRHEKETA